MNNGFTIGSRSEEWKKRPLLIGIGPIRSGSTWVHELLFGHSQVATTRIKEVSFFSDNYEKGMRWYGRQFSAITPSTKLFADISSRYLMSPYVAGRIAETVKDPLLLVGLRSPYERVLSWYKRYIHTEGDPSVLLSDGRWAETVQSGVMAPQLREFIDRFGRQRISYFDFDALRDDPSKTSIDLQKALGLDIETPLSASRHVNSSSQHRFRSLQRAVQRVIPGWHPLPPGVRYWLKFGPLNRYLADPARDDDLTVADARDVLWHFLDVFERDISELEQLLERDLSRWRFESLLSAKPDAGRPLPSHASGKAAAWPPVGDAPVA